MLMKHLRPAIISTGCALALLLASSLAAQNNFGGGAQGLGGMDWQNMDPQQIQEMIRQRMMEGYRTQLEIENAAEWQVIEERLNKVLQAQQELGATAFLS